MVTGCLMWPQCHVDTDEAVYIRLLMEMWITWYISDAMLSPMSSMTTSISMATWTTSWFHVSWMASFLKIAIHPYKELAKIGGTIHGKMKNLKIESQSVFTNIFLSVLAMHAFIHQFYPSQLTHWLMFDPSKIFPCMVCIYILDHLGYIIWTKPVT